MLDHSCPRSLAPRTGTQRAVVAEEVELGLDGDRSRTGCTASRARRCARQSPSIKRHRPRPASEGRLDRIEPASGGVLAADQPVDDDIDDAGLSPARPGGQAVGRQIDEPALDPGPRQAVLEQRPGERGRVRARQDLERKPDLVAGSLGKLVDRRGDDPRRGGNDRAGRNASTTPRRPGR